MEKINLDSSTDSLDFSVRVYNSLKNGYCGSDTSIQKGPIETVGQLCALNATQLWRFKGLGNRSLSEIRSELGKHGFSLYGEKVAVMEPSPDSPNTLPIEKGIPLPIIGRQAHIFDRIPWTKMEIGDSVRIEHTNCAGIKRRASKHGIEITVKCELTDGRKISAFRIWRIK